ncbi:hypothetical protein BE17_23170 [Sorangium cellulosum]|uniref:Transcriptional regulator n=1 Tax=Sorangium cellulosum TaxID=56 RepID=A0A150R1Q4_SORCE|nr:hypothetical protein BE17_23170 [Sorangium cellulosum]
MLEALGSRPRQGPLRAAIEQLCAWRTLRPAELGALLGMRPDNLTKRHLSAMVNQGWLLRTHPENPNHPEQAYRASQIPLVPFGDRDDDVTR